MKKTKYFAAALACLLAATMLFAACNSSTTLNVSANWRDGESYTYNVTLENASAESNTVKYNDLTFYRDFRLLPDKYDQVKPSAVTGSCTASFSVDTANDLATFTMTQDVTETYSGEEGYYYASALYETLTDAQKNYASKTEEEITFELHAVSSVTFTNDSKQTPKSSARTLTAFYVGKNNREVNDVDLSCTYDKQKATVTDNKTGKTEEYAVADGVIDALQIPVYLKSLNKENTTGSGYVAPTVYAFDQLSGLSVPLTISVAANYHMLLNIEGGYATVAAATVKTADSSAYFYTFEFNPKSTRSTDTGPEHVYDVIRFQSGYYVYELAAYTPEQIQQLQYTTTAS